MSRSTMAALIGKVRLYIGDDDTGITVFTDDVIEQALDSHKTLHWWESWRPLPTFVHDGPIVYQTYVGGDQYYEDGPKVQNLSYVDISSTITRFDAWEGVLYLSEQPVGIGIKVTSYAYNLYLVCAELCEAWATRLAREFDFNSERVRFLRSQSAPALLAAAARFRTMAKPEMGRLVQGDAARESTNASVGIVFPDLGGQALPGL